MKLKWILTLLLAAVVVLALQGCNATSKSSSNPYAPASESARNPIKAQELTMQAVEAMDAGDTGEAERLLRAALTADLYHGPAHNNLGVLYLKQGKRYEAAGEFEWARKLTLHTRDCAHHHLLLAQQECTNAPGPT